jgi:ABC-2 type transport system permease protein
VNSLDTLWFNRLSAFWKEAFQYGSYVVRSGFLAFLFAGFILGIYAYNKILETLPVTFPYAWITTPVLLLALAISPIRTFVKEADAVFLMPAEKRMSNYFRKSRVYSYMVQSMIVIIACLTVWPLYRHCLGDRKEPLLGILLFLLLSKFVQCLSSWQEGCLTYARHRIQFQALRWGCSLVLVYTLFVYGITLALLTLVISSVIMSLLFRRVPFQTIHWDYLVKTEQKHLSAIYLFFSWFVDVPQRRTSPKHRALWSQWTQLYAFTPINTYLYLYTKTLLRSEIFSILQRITWFGVLLLIVIPNPTVKLIVFGAVIYISSMQISSLEQQHRYSFWLYLYPLQPDWRVNALAKISFFMVAVQGLILSIVLLGVDISLPLTILVYSICCLASALYCFVIYPRKLRRKLLQT